jgi:hypothetical protein
MICLPTIDSTEEALNLHLQWLDGSLETITDDDINLLLQTYVAIAILHDIKNKASAPEIQILERIVSRLHKLPDHVIYSGNVRLLALVSVSSLRLFETRIPAIYSYLQFLVDGLLDTSLKTSPSAKPLLFLTSILGLNPKPTLDIVSYDLDLLTLLTAKHSSVKDTITDLENLTVYGIVPNFLLHGSIDVLESILIERLQTYDLEFALRLLRLLNALSVPNYPHASTRYGFQTAFNFIKNNQHSDGYLGFLEPEIKLLDKESQSQSSELQLKLQLTFSYLWLVAEMTKAGYRLFRDINFCEV